MGKKALAVCGFGVGSSMILKLTLDKVFKELAPDVEAENSDVTMARTTECDVIFTSPELLEDLKSAVDCPLYPIKHYADVAEVKAAAAQWLDSLK